MTIGQTILFLIWNKDKRWNTRILLCWRGFLFEGTLILLYFWSGKGGENSIALDGMMDLSAVIVLRVQILTLEGSAWLVVIIRHMMVGVAPAAAAQARARMGARARRRLWTGATPFSGQGDHAQWRGLVIVHGLVTLLLEVIMFAIILLLVGLFILIVLIFRTRVIVALIVSMVTVMLPFVVIMLVVLMLATVLAMMLLVVQITAASDRKMSSLLSFSCFFSLILSRMPAALSAVWHCPKRLRGHRLDCLCKLVLMCLGLRKENLFVLLLRCLQLHC
jgi:hypothetical protein